MNPSLHTHPLVSIVLPVFNGEEFIAAGISSVCEQSYTKWELLIVDDGSTDRTSLICQEYAAKDSRIKLFRQKNGGVNSARAKGIDHATGEFLTFLDADDLLTSDAIIAMLGGFSDQVDVVCLENEDKYFTRDDYMISLWGGTVKPGICTKMFRMPIFKKIDFHLERRLTMGEDLLLNSIYSLHIQNAHTISHIGYLVNTQNERSVTKTFKHKWDYEKYYFNKVEELFLNNLIEEECYEDIELLVNKSRLNAMKYVIMDGNTINYTDQEYISLRNYFQNRRNCLGPSEVLLFLVHYPPLYRFILRSYFCSKGKIKILKTKIKLHDN